MKEKKRKTWMKLKGKERRFLLKRNHPWNAYHILKEERENKEEREKLNSGFLSLMKEWRNVGGKAKRELGLGRASIGNPSSLRIRENDDEREKEKMQEKKRENKWNSKEKREGLSWNGTFLEVIIVNWTGREKKMKEKNRQNECNWRGKYKGYPVTGPSFLELIIIDWRGREREKCKRKREKMDEMKRERGKGYSTTGPSFLEMLIIKWVLRREKI